MADITKIYINRQISPRYGVSTGRYYQDMAYQQADHYNGDKIRPTHLSTSKQLSRKSPLTQTCLANTCSRSMFSRYLPIVMEVRASTCPSTTGFFDEKLSKRFLVPPKRQQILDSCLSTSQNKTFCCFNRNSINNLTGVHKLLHGYIRVFKYCQAYTRDNWLISS